MSRTVNNPTSDVAFVGTTPADTPGNPGPYGLGVLQSNPGCAGNRSTSLSDSPGLLVGGFLEGTTHDN